MECGLLEGCVMRRAALRNRRLGAVAAVLACAATLGLSGCCVGGGSSPTGMPTGVCIEPLWWSVRNAIVGQGRAGAMLELRNGEMVQLLGVCDRPWHQLGAADTARECLGHQPGEEAAQFIRDRVAGRPVRIELGEGVTY